MPTVTLKVTDETHGLWVESARRDGMTLSEWIRRRCALGAGEQGVASVAPAGRLPRDAGPTPSSASPSAAPAPSARTAPPPIVVAAFPRDGKRTYAPDLRPSEKKAKR